MQVIARSSLLFSQEGDSVIFSNPTICLQPSMLYTILLLRAPQPSGADFIGL